MNNRRLLVYYYCHYYAYRIVYGSNESAVIWSRVPTLAGKGDCHAKYRGEMELFPARLGAIHPGGFLLLW